MDLLWAFRFIGYSICHAEQVISFLEQRGHNTTLSTFLGVADVSILHAVPDVAAAFTACKELLLARAFAVVRLPDGRVPYYAAGCVAARPGA